jgi:D-serine deaminase-like pyridoxal phosphate-dependent protein
VHVSELPTPALVIDRDALDRNIATMAATRPGAALRPHVKAFKCTALARRLRDLGGHHSFCCATLREMEGMVAEGLADDLLLANETLDAARLGSLVAAAPQRVTVAIDSVETLEVAARAARSGPLAVLIDVNVGLPRCGCTPAEAGPLADAARAAGLEVRGVMGYEGHIVGDPDRARRVEALALSMDLLRAAHEAVGGGIVSSGGTGTYDLHDWADEVQAGSYVLLDTHYGRLGLPFEQAAFVDAQVVSTNADGYAIADAGLKCFGMDHGDPTVIGHRLFFLSDEHATFLWEDRRPVVGERVRLVPGHIDPTVAYHERAWVTSGDEVVDTWLIDLRNW